MTDRGEMNVAVPAPARRYNRWLGGKDNFAADRASADAIERVFPTITAAAVQNRRCLGRAVGYLAGECGVRQFLDVGCGLPTGRHNVHEIAQQIAPQARIVYVDNDPLVAVHARALMTSTLEGKVAVHEADLRRPDEITGAGLVHDTLDFTRPVAVLLFAVLHFIPDDTVHAAVRELMAAVPSGSYLALSHATFDPLGDQTRAALGTFTEPGAADGPFLPRTHEEITALLAGLDLVEPGLVSTVRWRPQLQPEADQTLGDHEVITYAAVAKKP
ncbi:SAM-dependent methyltransferase [Paractinoplanes durhamensis]|uniref:S-adenosyl methyltransferase n=1 Tax=Paractinoplanes durhamensis TaxID=113563 RepID=A0ABQ3Z0M9_9ACTN|nr:SAM-dependent methyltransferase [Actinoplanes durhamensis]GIE03390.1 hypothetical protein Adu01nite_47400 [Actinoplanes durhamensis]